METMEQPGLLWSQKSRQKQQESAGNPAVRKPGSEFEVTWVRKKRTSPQGKDQ